MTTIELLKKTNACKNTLAAMPEARRPVYDYHRTVKENQRL